MLVSYQWLSEYVEIGDLTPEELAERLTLSGVETEVVEKADRGISNVVVGYVEEREQHPNADRLSLCRVNVGEEVLQIVCGAPNVAQGQKVPVALVGATLPGGVKIKRSKLRGVESQGMICSAEELGLNPRLMSKEAQEGILVLPADLPVGQSVLEVLGLDDAVLELDLTPNRSDCLSMLGVAYEVAAILGRKVKWEPPRVQESRRPLQVEVQIEDQEACWRYAGRIIRNVKIGPSPLWMQNRLRAAGMRPINNVVDITNYVMLEYGQPLHAFDWEKIPSGRIVVRRAQSGERMKTLDGVERVLEEHMLIISDGPTPLGLAGVMGGEDSEVTEETRTIFLESAKFAPSSVRRTSRELGLRSEASNRFEKEVAWERIIPALDRAAQLMVELAGGEVDAGVADVIAREEEPVSISITLSRINAALGTRLTVDEVDDIFARLQLPFQREGEAWSVEVPSRRTDLRIPADLVEEVARMYGYDRIPITSPEGQLTAGGYTASQALRRNIQDYLVAHGWTEAITYTLVPAGEEAAGGIRVQMPMSEEHASLRTQLIPGLFQSLVYNVRRNNQDLALFELGKVFLSAEERLTRLPQEKYLLAGVLSGSWQRHWSVGAQKVDFFLLKGMVEGLLSHLRLPEVRYVPLTDARQFHPGRTAEIWIGEERVGVLGQLHPEWTAREDVDEEVYAFQLDVDQLESLAQTEQWHYQPLPQHPAIARDLALVLREEVPAAQVMRLIRESAGSWLERIELFDLYRGQQLQEGEKSLAISLLFRHPERTLQDEEVAEVMQEVLARLEGEVGARLR